MFDRTHDLADSVTFPIDQVERLKPAEKGMHRNLKTLNSAVTNAVRLSLAEDNAPIVVYQTPYGYTVARADASPRSASSSA